MTPVRRLEAGWTNGWVRGPSGALGASVASSPSASSARCASAQVTVTFSSSADSTALTSEI